MPYQIFARICVGAPLAPEIVSAVHSEFLQSLNLPVESTATEVFEHLRLDTPKHKLHEPDIVRYERALEAFIDEKWQVDCALGGRSSTGLLDTKRGFIFVGVRVEQFELTLKELPRYGTTVDRPQWLTKGDLSIGSGLAKSLGDEVRKEFEHAVRSYSRAAAMILTDARTRTKPLKLSKQHEVDWAMCQFAIDSHSDSIQHRHGRQR